jgi:hypothetical protein
MVFRTAPRDRRSFGLSSRMWLSSTTSSLASKLWLFRVSAVSQKLRRRTVAALFFSRSCHRLGNARRGCEGCLRVLNRPRSHQWPLIQPPLPRSAATSNLALDWSTTAPWLREIPGPAPTRARLSVPTSCGPQSRRSPDFNEKFREAARRPRRGAAASVNARRLIWPMLVPARR